ncbi:MAG: serine--tRNA ligase, partial [Acidobacteria bacterium]|nr:serine--tRNA ligase [Acidobacteriota bacterium]
MIDANLLRENPEAIRVSQRARGANVELVDQAVEADKVWRKALVDFETLRAEQNAKSKLVATASKEERPALIAAGQALAAEVKAAEALANAKEAELQEIIWKIENVVIDGVPAGGEDDYVVIREEGVKPQFSFKAQDHVALGESLDLIDIERGAKISGSRFYFLKGWGARLELALMNLALDQASKAGFTALITPTLVKPEVMAGTGFLGAHADEIYYLPADDLYLTGTSE